MGNNQSVLRHIVDLADIVAAPLIATVEADFLALRRCLDLVREICFEPAPRQDRSSADLGHLRTIRFRAEQPGPGGQPQSVFVQIPVLSLITLPLIQVLEAEFEMSLYLVEARVQAAEPRTSPAESGHPADANLCKRSVPRWQAALAPQNSDPAQRHLAPHLETPLKVRMKVRESDMPAGISSLLQLAAQGTHALTSLPEPAPPESKEPEKKAAIRADRPKPRSKRNRH